MRQSKKHPTPIQGLAGVKRLHKLLNSNGWPLLEMADYARQQVQRAVKDGTKEAIDEAIGAFLALPALYRKHMVDGRRICQFRCLINDRTRHELWAEVDHYLRILEASAADVSDLMPHFACLRNLKDNQQPDYGRMLRARRAFLTLPEDRQRKILNGWSPCPGRPQLAEAVHDSMQGTVARFLLIDAAKFDRRRLVYASQDYALWAEDDLPSALRVMILEGTSQAEAIAYLEASLRMVRNNWRETAGGGQEWLERQVRLGHEKRPQTAQPNALKPASQKSGKVVAAAAA